MTRSTQQPKPDRKVTTLRLQEMKVAKEKISALTAYDFLTARLLDQSGIDVILVGDSASMVFAAGRLVVRSVQRNQLEGRLGYAWRTPVGARRGAAKKPPLGLALRWWLEQLESETTRKALLERHGSPNNRPARTRLPCRRTVSAKPTSVPGTLFMLPSDESFRLMRKFAPANAKSSCANATQPIRWCTKLWIVHARSLHHASCAPPSQRAVTSAGSIRPYRKAAASAKAIAQVRMTTDAVRQKVMAAPSP